MTKFKRTDRKEKFRLKGVHKHKIYIGSGRFKLRICVLILNVTSPRICVCDLAVIILSKSYHACMICVNVKVVILRGII